MVHSGFFQYGNSCSSLLCTLFFETHNIWTFLFSYTYFPSLYLFVLLFHNVSQLYFLILLLANKGIFLGNSLIIFVCHVAVKTREYLLSKSCRPSIKGKWGQTLLTAVVAVRSGEVIISAVCGYCISLGLLNSQVYSTVLCSEDLL